MGRSAARMARLFVCAADHPCILGGGHFAPAQVETIGVDGEGIVDLDALRAALQRHDASGGLPLVAMHLANNETGVMQPVREIGALVKAAGGSWCSTPFRPQDEFLSILTEGYADFLIISSHKIGGPKGAGAIIGAADLLMPKPLVSGGGQEKGHRAGTENLAAIAGFGAAAREAAAALGGWRQCAAGATPSRRRCSHMAPDAEIFGRGAERLPNTTFFGIPGMKAETLQIAFDLGGIALSAGSACSSGKVGPSHVLKAMGHGDNEGALRVSIGARHERRGYRAFRRSTRRHRGAACRKAAGRLKAESWAGGLVEQSCFSRLTGEFGAGTHYMELTPPCEHSGSAIVRKLRGLEPGVDGER